jgi:hypothetical protein
MRLHIGKMMHVLQIICCLNIMDSTKSFSIYMIWYDLF